MATQVLSESETVESLDKKIAELREVKAFIKGACFGLWLGLMMALTTVTVLLLRGR